MSNLNNNRIPVRIFHTLRPNSLLSKESVHAGFIIRKLHVRSKFVKGLDELKNIIKVPGLYILA